MKNLTYFRPVLLFISLSATATLFALQQAPAPVSSASQSAVPAAPKAAPPIPANAPHAADIRAARQVAQAWIALLDAGKFDEAYEQMGQTARDQISTDQWKDQLKASRRKYGKLSSRNFQYTDYATTLKNAPPGQYVVLDYLCVFASGQSAPETIVMAKVNGQWQVAGFAVA